MGFTNFGNFGKKLSEFNAERREKNMEKLRVKAQNTETDNKRLEEEMVLRKSLEKNANLKKQVKEQKFAKVKSFVDRVQKASKKHEKNSKGNKFDILGNNDSKKKTPELFGNQGNTKFKF